jgi:hypothetical protein
LYTNQLTGFNTAPYSSGTIVGTIWTGIGWGYSGSGVFYNDGRTVKFIGNGEFYFSADTGLTAHPSCWSMGQVWDGMIVTQHYYAVKGDRSVCAGPFNQNALIKIQHVTVPMGVYSNSVISWEINPSRPYVTLDFHGTDSELGIVLPTSDDTEGRGVAGFSANGRGTGPIASGTIDVDTGNLIQLKRLQLEVSP